MTKDATEESNSNDGDAEDAELDLAKLFEAIPARRSEEIQEPSGNDDAGESGSPEDELPFELDLGISESTAESAENEPDDIDIGGEADIEAPGNEPDLDPFSFGDRSIANEDTDSRRTLEELVAATGGAADGPSADSDSRFGGLLGQLDPTNQNQDLDSLLNRLTESPQPADTTDSAELPTAETPSSGAGITFRSDKSKLLGASNTLFSATRSARTSGDVCRPLFSIHSTEDLNVMLISLQESSEKRLDSFFDAQASQPANLAVVTGDDSVRSTTRSKGMDVDQDMSNISVKVVNDPGDLTRLGITISNILKSWIGNGHDTIVCFDSVSVLLQYASLQRVFRFIHVLQGRLDEVGAHTHFHLDPGAHNEQTIGTLQPLFDGEITVEDDGTLVYE